MRLRILFLAGLAAAVAVAAAAAPASARMHSPYRGHRIIPANPGALDGFTQPSGAYSFRKLRSTYAGPAVRLRRASDQAELDINFLGCTGFTGCPWDSAAAAAHCAATTCSIVTWYDQSGAARNVTQATQANQPALVFACNGALPCAQSDSTDFLAGASFTPAAGAVSLNIVASRTSGTGPCAFLRENGLATANSVTGSNGVASNWRMVGGTSGFTAASASDAAWHTALGLMNGALSSLSIDGAAPVTGTVTGNTAAGTAMAAGGSASSVCSLSEAVFWDNYLLTAPEAAALAVNQRSYYATP